MKRLILLRHGEAEPHRSREDHSRHLTERGRSQAERVGRQIANLDLGRLVIISSDAARARETAEIVATHLNRCPVQFEADFYSGDYRVISSVLTKTPDTCDSVIVVGHNPHWSSAVEIFSDQSADLSTAEAAVLELSDEQAVQWRVHLQDFRFVSVLRP